MLLRGFDFGFGSGGRAEDGGFSDGREGLGNVAAISGHSQKGRATMIALKSGARHLYRSRTRREEWLGRLPEPAATKSSSSLGLMTSQLFEDSSACVFYRAPRNRFECALSKGLWIRVTVERL